MKHGLLLAAIFTLGINNVLAGGFLSVHSPNGIDVWAAGKAGLVFHSLDGGATWQTLTLGSADLNAIYTVGTRIWILGEGGVCYRSFDNGNSWSLETINDGKNLNAVEFLDALRGWAVGDSGSVLRTPDGGLSWTVASIPAASMLTSIAVADSLTAYVVGEDGMVMKTTDGGSTWVTIGDPLWTSDLTAVAAAGPLVHVVGNDGFWMRSTDGGASWTAVKAQTDSRSDVRDVVVRAEDNVYVVGGGGYIKHTTDGGVTQTWQIHPLLASINGIFFYDDQTGWACTDLNNAILRTTDGGTTWQLPTGTTVTSSWTQQLNSASSIGNTFAINPLNENHIYVALGRFIYMSANRGESWVQTATISSTSGSTHSFFISPRDTNVYVAAYTAGGDHIRKSTDRGLTWTVTISRGFSSYGMPLEMDLSHPDTLIFGPEDSYLYRSVDFGSTWQILSQPNFSSPCDLVVVRDSANIIWVGDSDPGRISRSTDAGLTWTLAINVGSSEIPTIAHGNQQNSLGFATAWGSGGLKRTTDYGATWTTVSTAGSTWGVDVSKDDPNVVMFGVYGGSTSYLSTNAGGTFSTTSLSGSNYALLCYDRSTFFAQQSGGVFKHRISYIVPTTNAEAVVLLSPNGGEEWVVGEEEEIRWTSSNIGTVRIEFRQDGMSGWELVAGGIAAGDGMYPWTVPNTPTSGGRMRVSDEVDGNPQDSSDGVFSITVSAVSVTPESLSFGSVSVGEMVMDTLRITNTGTGTLVVTSVTTGSGVFVPGRTSFTIGAGLSDTLSVLFVPAAVQSYRDTLVLMSNALGGEYGVVLTGEGSPTLSVEVEEGLPREYVLEQNYPNPFNPTTEIRYGVPRAGRVRLEVYTMLGEEVGVLMDAYQGAGWYRVEFGGKDGRGRELSSGLYLYRLEAGDFISTKKMMLVK